METSAIRRDSGIHFSLKSLLLLSVATSLVAAALRDPTYAGAAAATTLTLLGLFAAIAAALFDARQRRPLWLGYAIFSSGYLLLLFIANDTTTAMLGSERLDIFLFTKIHFDVQQDDPGGMLILQALPEAPTNQITAKPPPSANLSLILNCFFPLARELLFETVDPPAPQELPAPDPNLPAGKLPTTDDDPFASPPSASSGIQPADDPDDGAKKLAMIENFTEIARSAWAWILGGCGACLASCLARRNGRDQREVIAAPAVQIAKKPKQMQLPIQRIYTTLFWTWVAIGGGYALCSPSETWTLIALSAAAIGASLSLIGALFGGTRPRPFLAGFALGCGGYLAFASLAGPIQINDNKANHFLNATANSKLLYCAYEALFPRYNSMLPNGMATLDHSTPNSLCAVGSVTSTNCWARTDFSRTEAPESLPTHFLIIGQSLWTIALGFLGGVFAQWLVLHSAKNAARRSLISTPASKGPGNDFA